MAFRSQFRAGAFQPPLKRPLETGGFKHQVRLDDDGTSSEQIDGAASARSSTKSPLLYEAHTPGCPHNRRAAFEPDNMRRMAASGRFLQTAEVTRFLMGAHREFTPGVEPSAGTSGPLLLTSHVESVGRTLLEQFVLGKDHSAARFQFHHQGNNVAIVPREPLMSASMRYRCTYQ